MLAAKFTADNFSLRCSEVYPIHSKSPPSYQDLDPIRSPGNRLTCIADYPPL
eukprot:jgi/Botrbrau1/17819/Bobra.0127s0064.1